MQEKYGKTQKKKDKRDSMTLTSLSTNRRSKKQHNRTQTGWVSKAHPLSFSSKDKTTRSSSSTSLRTNSKSAFLNSRKVKIWVVFSKALRVQSQLIKSDFPMMLSIGNSSNSTTWSLKEVNCTCPLASPSTPKRMDTVHQSQQLPNAKTTRR